MTSYAGRVVLMVLLSIAVCQAADTAHGARTHWELKGNLSEACSCQVPCGCNFRSRPSHDFCWAMFSLDITKGRYGRVKLNGLHLAAAHADKAVVWYIDRRSTPRQFEALKVIARRLGYNFDLPVFFKAAKISQVVTDKGNDVEIEGYGGFKADYVIGGDGRTPIVAENILAWNIPRAIKGRTEYLRYSDTYGNRLDFKNTNSNEGKFDWTDKTPRYF